VPFGIGTETQGSITTPSGFCGVSGLRPTYGRVSRHGAMALCWTMDKIGPMCRTAEDCGHVLAAIAGRDPLDPTSADRRFTYPPKNARRGGFRLAVLAKSVEDAQPEVIANFEASLAVLREFATLEDVELPDLPYNAVSGVIIPAEASAAFDELIASGGIAQLTAPEDRVKPYAYEAISAKDYLKAMRLRRHIAQAMDDLLAPFDALVSPTLNVVATPIDESFNTALRRRAVPLTAAANLAGIPAITVPNGFGERGLPTSLQFTGRAWSEARLLAVAAAYQKQTDWHRRVPGV
jgi:aspartyl-tRNA(Asn)/glutamyl-tRNA(Gln) amidotransferase subunit A